MYLRALSHWQLGQVTERLGQSLSTTDSASNSFVESIKHTFRQLSVDASHSVASAPRTATTLTVLQAGLERDSTMDSAQQHCPRPGENEAATWARTRDDRRRHFPTTGFCDTNTRLRPESTSGIINISSCLLFRSAVNSAYNCRHIRILEQTFLLKPNGISM